jgi:hypothetical protein
MSLDAETTVSVCNGDVRAWIEQEAIHLKAIDGIDPVELTAEEALKLGRRLIAWSEKLTLHEKEKG